MSETAHYKGKLKKLEIPTGMDRQEFCKSILQKNNCYEDLYDGDYEEYLRDTFYEKYAFVNNDIFEVLSQKEIGDYDIFEVHDNNDGTYDYEVMYYDGGCSFDEALEYAFEDINC